MTTPNTAFKVTHVEKVSSSYLFRSDFYEIKNWEYAFAGDSNSTKGFNDCLCVVFVRTGNFLFDLSRDRYDMHTGHIVIDKPNYEYSLRPSAGACSIFNFTNDFYQGFVEDLNLKHSFFFSNSNILSLMLKATAETEYLHFQIAQRAPTAGKLEIDNLVLEFLYHVLSALDIENGDIAPGNSMKSHHLRIVEAAKEYIINNFTTDISLKEISEHCCVSPFHFSRIFKQFAGYSPHQFLHNVRLKHGEMLLKNNTSLQISDVAVLSGFNSLEYFATAFRQKYKASPTSYRSKALL